MADIFAEIKGNGASVGSWDSIHVFEAVDRARVAHYKLTSTVILNMANEGAALGELDLSGNMTRQIEQDLPVENDDSHVPNIGKLVEEMELKMRNLLRKLSYSIASRQMLTRGRGGVFRKGKGCCWRFEESQFLVGGGKGQVGSCGDDFVHVETISSSRYSTLIQIHLIPLPDFQEHFPNPSFPL